MLLGIEKGEELSKSTN